MQNILFHISHTFWEPNFERNLELIQLHLDKGDKVTIFYCSGNLHACDPNRDHSLVNCFTCVVKRIKGFDQLKYKRGQLVKRNFENLDFSQKQIIQNWTCDFDDLQKLKKAEYEGVDIGMAVASSLISVFRDPEPNVIQHKQFLTNLFKASLSIYFSYKNHFKDSRPDLVYAFNGRFSDIRPVIRLCEIHGINYKVHELGSTIYKYDLGFNHLLHSPGAFHFNVINSWISEKDDQKKIAIAQKFYEDSRNGISYFWKSYTVDHNPTELPDGWDPNARNIVIFNSSDDEYAAVGKEFNNQLFQRQIDALKFLKKSFEGHHRVRLFLRIHPNLAGVKSSVARETLQLNGGNFVVIPAESKISTYKLMDSASVVLTFGSTTGIEATFWGKPSILMAVCRYSKLDVAYIPKTKEELIELITDVNKPKPKIGTYIYAYYRSTFGHNYKYYYPESYNSGTFKGVKIEPNGYLIKLSYFKFFRGLIRTFLMRKPVV